MEISPERYLCRIRRQKQRYVIHVIDSLRTNEGPMLEASGTPCYRPLYTKLALNSELVRFQRTTVVPDNRPLEVSTDGHWKIIEIDPNPELTIGLD